MPRYRITLEYDGSDFAGWQRQDNAPSVQAAVEHAAAAITGGRAAVSVQGAGRTDAGVHALGQVAHFDLPESHDMQPRRLPLALNAHLPESIRVIAADKTAGDFNARFDAMRKIYRYRICTRKIAPVFGRGMQWHIGRGLDCDAMREAAGFLTGRHDFTSFRATQCQAESAERTLDVLRIDDDPAADCITITAEARSFLHHQVRNITGTLVEVGRGRWQADSMGAILAARDRARAGPTAPAHGLTLMAVEYESRSGGGRLEQGGDKGMHRNRIADIHREV